MGYLTLQDLVNKRIREDAPLTDGQILHNLIKDDELSDEKVEMADGVNYYGATQDIEDTDFRKYTDVNGNTATQDNKANNHIVHPFHRRQVVEKVAYLLKEPLTITYDTEDEITEEDEEKRKELEKAKKDKEKEVQQVFSDVLGRQFDDMLVDWATGASNKGVEWVHPYFDGQEFDYVIIDARQVIAIYDTSKQKKLVQLIRYYNVTVNEAGVEVERKHAEWWFPDRVDYYEQDAQDNFKLTESKSHFRVGTTADAKRKDANWGRVPFIELRNNTNRYSDLRFIKSMSDDYDKNVSEYSNNLEDIQEAIWTAVGIGDKPSEIRDNLRKFKVVATTDSEGKIGKETIEIPHEARDSHLKNLEENIYCFGMGINPKTDEFGQNPSGVALKFLYMPLDLKAGLLERKLSDALYEFFWFVAKYLELSGQEAIDVEQFTFTFNKTMITNETEKIDNFVKAKGHISERTALENMPWVDDVDQEVEDMERDGSMGPKIDLSQFENRGNGEVEEEELENVE